MVDYVTWAHHFDFTPAADEILYGDLTVYLRDDEQVDTWWSFELGLGVAEDGTWDLGEVDTGDFC